MLVDLIPVKKITDYQCERSLGFRLRQKRSKRIVDLIDSVYADKHRVDIVDIGGTREYWNIIPIEFLRQRNTQITIINLPGAAGSFEFQDDVFSSVEGDGCNLTEIKDNEFDIAHSNSVIEHVGSWGKMVDFARETRRVAPIYYVQTPNYFFPIEPHFVLPFFHWLPLSIKVRLVMKYRLGCFPRASSIKEAKEYIDLCRLLTKQELRRLFPDATIHKERIFPLVKSFVMIRHEMPG